MVSPAASNPPSPTCEYRQVGQRHVQARQHERDEHRPAGAFEFAQSPVRPDAAQRAVKRQASDQRGDAGRSAQDRDQGQRRFRRRFKVRHVQAQRALRQVQGDRESSGETEEDDFAPEQRNP